MKINNSNFVIHVMKKITTILMEHVKNVLIKIQCNFL